jgi:hypothetical protein
MSAGGYEGCDQGETTRGDAATPRLRALPARCAPKIAAGVALGISNVYAGSEGVNRDGRRVFP